MHKQTLLAAIGECRKALRAAEDHIQPTVDEYKASGKVAVAIDDLAGLLSGDRTYFHDRMAAIRREVMKDEIGRIYRNDAHIDEPVLPYTRLFL